MDKELGILLQQTITKYPYVSKDDHNDYTWSPTGATFAGRVEYRNKLIRDINGQESISTCQIYCNGDTSIDTRDKITAVGLIPTYPEILQVERQPDEYGAIYYTCIYIQNNFKR